MFNYYVNVTWAFKKVNCKGEPYRFSVQTYKPYIYIGDGSFNLWLKYLTYRIATPLKQSDV